jgi:hypothetical protein
MEIPAEHLEVALGFVAANRYHRELVKPRGWRPAPIGGSSLAARSKSYHMNRKRRGVQRRPR